MDDDQGKNSYSDDQISFTESDLDFLFHLQGFSHSETDSVIPEALVRIRDFLKLDEIALIGYNADKQSFLSYKSSDCSGLNPSHGFPDFDNYFPDLIRLFREGKTITAFSWDHLPEVVETDKQSLRFFGIESLPGSVVNFLNSYRYGILAYAAKSKPWDRNLSCFLKYAGGALVSILERNNLEKKLRQSEELYKSIVNTQQDPICRLQSDGTLIFANPVYLDIFGLKNEDIPGRRIFSLMSPEEGDYVKTIFESLVPRKPDVKTEHRVIYRDGTERWMSWVNSGIFDESGNLVEIESVGRDIHELKTTMKKLEDALKEISALKEQLEKENVYLKEKYLDGIQSSGIITRNPAMLKILENVKQVAQSDSPVLITGETGTGKELIAKEIHEKSNRQRRVMVTVNCAAIPSSLIESELFGREKGAYTGAMTRQIGRFEMADHSTIFLDEVAELPPETQSKLLRVIQFGEFQMLGSPVTRKVDVRIVAATNRNLLKEIEKGSFRRDLFYRLNVFPVSLPPLRDRKEDIPVLVWSFVDTFSARMGKRIKNISQRSMDKLMSYTWPGNIRELRNIIEFSMILSNRDTLNIHLHDEHAENESGPETLEESEKKHIFKILNQTNWRVRGRGGAAEMLGMNESTLRFRMKKLGITRE